MKKSSSSIEFRRNGVMNRITYSYGASVIEIEQLVEKQNGFLGKQWKWERLFFGHGSQIKKEVDFYKSVLDFYEEEKAKDTVLSDRMKETFCN